MKELLSNRKRMMATDNGSGEPLLPMTISAPSTSTSGFSSSQIPDAIEMSPVTFLLSDGATALVEGGPKDMKTYRQRFLLILLVIIRFIGQLIRRLLVMIRNALFSIVILTVLFIVYDALYMAQYKNVLNDRMHVDQVSDVRNRMNISSKAEDYDATVFMMSRDRLDYMESIPPFLNQMNKRFKPNVRTQFILFDIESQNPLTLPESLQEHVRSGKLKIIRKEPGSGSRGISNVVQVENSVIDTNNNNQKKQFAFSVWESWAFAMNHISSDFIFYFDNCNMPSEDFLFQRYLSNRDNLYFPNSARYYTQNFAAQREDFVRFLNELPRHIIQDKRSFFGGDQLLIWYLNSAREQAWLLHIDHPELTEYSKWNTHSIAIWRVFLYMNRYSHPNGPNAMGNMRAEYCRDKQPICAYGGIARRFLGLWGVYHVIDTAMRLEILFTPVTMIVNMTGSWVLGFFVTAVLNIILFSLFWQAWSSCFSCLYYLTKSTRLSKRAKPFRADDV